MGNDKGRILIMETSERIRGLGVVLKAGMMLVDFVRGEVEAVGTVEPDLAGELAEVKAENAQLNREVSRLEKMAPAAHTEPSSPPPAATARGATDKLPLYVKREGKKFRCQINRKELQFSKGGFATPQAAHDYAVERIRTHGGAASTRERTGVDKDLPRFVYRRNGKYDVLCNRTKMYFCKTRFMTADEASKWAEAEFVRKSSAGSSHANRPDPARPQKPGEIKKAIDETREQTGNVARQWWECAGCSHELGVPGDELPDICPKCGSVKVVKMEGFAGADAVEVRS